LTSQPDQVQIKPLGDRRQRISTTFETQPSIVPVPCNHNMRVENVTIKKGEMPEDWANKPAKRCQKDLDASWTKKHGKSHYCYKNHVNADRMHKLVHRYQVTDAAVHDS
jgi:hypothetical protein